MNVLRRRVALTFWRRAPICAASPAEEEIVGNLQNHLFIFRIDGKAGNVCRRGNIRPADK